MPPGGFPAFADEWLAAWNAHDLERILSHYAEDVVFESPLIRERFGKASGRVQGKPELRAYWSAGVGPGSTLHFDLLGLFEGIDGGAIRYFSRSRGREVVEVFAFDAAGLVARAGAFYAVG